MPVSPNKLPLTVGVLGGMGPDATVDFMSKVIAATPAGSDQEHVHMLVDHNPHVPDRTRAILGEGGEPGPVLAAMAKQLEQAGASMIVMPCNTAHAFQADIEAALAVPFVSIIDETVEVIHSKAMEIVLEEQSFHPYRERLEDADYMSAHDALRKKYFLPVRPLEHYLDSLRTEGFDVASVRHRRIPARVSEWYDFLSVYHEGVLGWVGGAEKIVGGPASAEVIEDRLALMRLAMDRVFNDAFEFGASWTYVTCEPRG